MVERIESSAGEPNPHYKPPVMRWNDVEIILQEGSECGIAYDSGGLLSVVVRAPYQPWPHGAEPRPDSIHILGPGHKTYQISHKEFGPAVGHEFQADPESGECLVCQGYFQLPPELREFADKLVERMVEDSKSPEFKVYELIAKEFERAGKLNKALIAKLDSYKSEKEQAEARAEKAEARLAEVKKRADRISGEIIGGFTKAGAYMLGGDNDPLAPGEIGLAIGNLRSAIRREFDARIAALEAENAKLCDLWPEGIAYTGQAYEAEAGWWIAVSDQVVDFGPRPTKEAVVRDYCGSKPAPEASLVSSDGWTITREQVRELATARDNAVAEATKLRGELDSLKNAHEHLKINYDDYSKEVKRQRARLDDAIDEIGKLRAELKTLEIERDEATAKLASLEKHWPVGRYRDDRGYKVWRYLFDGGDVSAEHFEEPEEARAAAIRDLSKPDPAQEAPDAT